MTNVKQGLIEQVESCIDTLKAYISGDEIKIVTPAIVVDKGHDEHILARDGQVSYLEIEQTDEAFKHYCIGLDALGFNTLRIRIEYCGLRNKCDEIFKEQRR